MQLCFSFSFFLHGESTVCMSVDVRLLPLVRRVNKHHIAIGQNSSMPGRKNITSEQNQNLHDLGMTMNCVTLAISVILAPHGLAGTLTGGSYKYSDPGTHKILDEWRHFYPVDVALKSPMYDTPLPPAPHSSPHPVQSPSRTSPPSATQPSCSQTTPPVVEVRVGGVLMRYPACYVLYTSMDDVPQTDNPSLSSACRNNFNNNPTAPKSRISTFADSETAACPSSLSPGKPQGSIGPEVRNYSFILAQGSMIESFIIL